MPAYESYSETAATLNSILVDKMLKPIAFRQFEHDRGLKVREVLPDKSEEYDFASHGFDGYIDPDRRAFESPAYNSRSITPNRIAAQPRAYLDMVDNLYAAWWETFGELTMSNQPNHPGEPPMAKDDLQTSLEELSDEWELLCADPTMDDLLEAIRDKNYQLAARFLNVDNAQQLFNPGGGHELSELFTNGDIHIVFHDRDIAVLKPEYDFALKERVMSQQRSRFERVRFTGEPPEEAFVVGIDDTPTGLFAHSIDGTRLDVDQDVSREYLHDVMGFDWNYTHDTDLLSLSEGDRVRLQGDLAVRLVEKTTPDAFADRCNLPIDNHLAVLTHAAVPDGESLEEEPIRVQIPEESTLNIMHDEHENVATQLPPGVYEFYLLPRGPQPEAERPNWPIPTTSTV